MLTLADVRRRLGSMEPMFSRGLDEAKAKREDVIRWGTASPDDWREVILRGPQFGVATPFAKEPPNTLHTDKPINLKNLSTNAIPKTDYHRICDMAHFLAEQEVWDGRPCTRYYRLAWRVMIPASTERSLFPVILPPGPTHVDTVNTLKLRNDLETAIAAGFWSSLPLDYLLRATGRGHLRNAEAKAMPMGSGGHPLASSLLLRVLRLNCLTSAYSSLWNELYRPEWQREKWAAIPSGLSEALATDSLDWDSRVPLRSEHARRAALVELDVIVGIWLGLSLDELISLYSSRFPQLVDYESEMWFDKNGRKLAANFNQWGHGQTKEHWVQFQAHLDSPSTVPPPEGYTPPFCKANRIAEYRQAHAAFIARLRSS